MNKKKCIIVSGGMLEEDFLRSYLKESNYEMLIAADKGLEFLHRIGCQPTQIVGDFDSIDPAVIDAYQKQADIPIHQFNPVKDASDTEIAIRLAMELGAQEIEILGATGGRIDHLWANVQCLYLPFQSGIPARIVDSQNRICLIKKETRLERASCYGPYFSLFPLGGAVKKLSIRGAKYPLKDYELLPYDSLCVSNSFQEDQVEICYQEGVLLLMETRDKQ